MFFVESFNLDFWRDTVRSLTEKPQKSITTKDFSKAYSSLIVRGQEAAALAWRRLCTVCSWIFENHIVFFQLVTITNSEITFGILAALMVLNSAVMPRVFIQFTDAWTSAIDLKSSHLQSVGIELVYAATWLSLLNLCQVLLEKYLIRHMTLCTRKSLLEKLRDPWAGNVIREHERENDGKSRDDSSKNTSLVTVISQEIAPFIASLFRLHRFGARLIFWGHQTTLALLEIGLGYQGLALIGFAGICTLLVAYYYPTSHILKSYAIESQDCEIALQSLIKNSPREDTQPNFHAVTYHIAEKKIDQMHKDATKFDQTIALTTEINDWVGYITDPILVIGLFLGTYLSSDMSQSTLKQSVGRLSQMMLVAQLVLDRLPDFGEMSNFAKDIQSVITRYLNKDHSQAVRRMNGWRAEGELNYISENPSSGQGSPLTFQAVVYEADCSGTEREKRRYQQPSQDTKPLQFDVNQMVYVPGDNGAGKSMMFNTLSRSIPGVTTGKNIKSDPGFMLFCEQKLVDLPPKDNDESWTPMQILATLWPEKLEGNLAPETLNDDAILTYHTGQGTQKHSVAVSVLKDKVNQYLMRLSGLDKTAASQISYNGSGGQKTQLRLALYFTMAEILRPRLFLIDEPYNQLSHEATQSAQKIFIDMKQEGHFSDTTVFVVDHYGNNSERLKHFDQVLVLKAPEKPNNAVIFHGNVANYQEFMREHYQCQNVPSKTTYSFA